MARIGLGRNPKFARLKQAIGTALARGSLELLWDVGYEACDDFIGDAVDVEAACEWQGEPGVLFKALLDAGGTARVGFIEPADEDRPPGTYKIHDLWENAPDYVKKRAIRDQERRASGQTLSEARAIAGRKSAESRAVVKQLTSKRQLLAAEREQISALPSHILSSPIKHTAADAAGPVLVESVLPPPKWAIQELWNEITGPPLPRWEEMTKARERSHRLRLQERLVDGPKGWREVITRISLSRYCHTGTKGDWRANPDWLLRPGTAAAVLEGQYGCIPPPPPVPTLPCAVPGCGRPAAGNLFGVPCCEESQREWAASGHGAREWLVSKGVVVPLQSKVSP